MHVHFLDPYRPRSSIIHQLDPRVKLVVTVAFILTNALLPTGSWPVYILLFALILSVEMLSKLGVTYVLKRTVLALPFMLAALPLILTTPGDYIFRLPVGHWMISPTFSGLERLISLSLKSWLSIQAAIVLAASTPFPELLVAMRAIGVPRLLVSIFGLMWRYLFVLVDESIRLLRARAARSGTSGYPDAKAGGSLTWRARVAGGMAGNLLVRGFERSDRIYMAMVSRGFDGEVRSLPLPSIRAIHWAVLVGCISVLAMLILFAYLIGG
jgi:cobalt/nickel transport system permease protein